MASTSFSHHVLRALHAARTPGWMFPAHLMDVYFEQEVSEQGAIALMSIGTHCLDAEGYVSKAAVTLLADVCMAASVRGYAGKNVRVATVTMRVSFNQLPRYGYLRAVAKVQFLPADRAVPTAVVSVHIADQAGVLCATGEATFAVLENKHGTAEHPLPTQSTLVGCLNSSDLNDEEQSVWKRAKESESHGLGALDHFWSLICPPSRTTENNIKRDIEVGKHNANRVGHLQGGILMALLARASETMLNDAYVLGDISVQYLEPVVGPCTQIEAKSLRNGRNTTFVQLNMRNAEGLLLTTAQASLVKSCAK